MHKPYSVLVDKLTEHGFSKNPIVVNKQRDAGVGHVVRIPQNALDCCSFKTFNRGLNHSKIRTARQFCDFQCLLFLFRQ